MTCTCPPGSRCPHALPAPAPAAALVRRDRFFLVCLELLAARVPYVWGGKSISFVPGKAWKTGGLDCSGFVSHALHLASDGKLDFRSTHNTDRMWAEFARVGDGELALPGDLVLYYGPGSTGPEDVEHVMVYAGEGAVIGQAYGGRLNVSPDYSLARGHVTKALPIRYRERFAGIVRPPFVSANGL